MTRGARIALGCLGAGCLVAAGAAALAVFGVGAGARWLKQKAESFVGQEQRIEELQRKANAVPFRPPEDGEIPEERLLKFLEIRKRVFSVYERHRADYEALADERGPELRDLRAALSVFGDVRLALAQAMAEVGMSEAEYQYMVQAVYHSAWASAVEKDAGKPASEAMEELMKHAGEAMKKGVEEARKEGVPGAKDLPDSAVRSAEEGMARAGEALKKLDAPRANVELFRRHEAEIKKYAMHGLELIGL